MQDEQEYTLEEIRAATELYPSLWVDQYSIKTSNGFPFEFDDHRFMLDIMNDMSPLQVGLKAPQVGWSESMIIKSFYVAKKLKKDIIYTLPTDTDVKEMAGGKINRIVAQNPILGKWVKEHDSVEQKGIGDNIIYYRGTWTQKAAMMVSSQLNIHDETDASNADVITQYETRQQAQTGGMRWYFSHPSIAGHGVDVYWQQSDKKEWVIDCEHCSKKQILTWPDSINQNTEQYQCKYCFLGISDETRRMGEWKPTAMGEFSGYHISQMMCPWITASKILEAKNDPKKTEQYFYNYVLGLPYVGSENKITSDVVLKNVVPEVNEQKDRIIIGVDTGTPWYLTCMNKQGVFYYEELKRPGEAGVDKNYDPKERVRELLKRWPDSIVVGDQGGDLSPLRILQAQMPGRVYLVTYRKDRKKKEMITWGEDDEIGTVRVDRNDYFQLMVEQLRDTGRIRLNGKPEEWEDWARQFDNVYREVKTVMERPGKDVATNYGVELIWKRNGSDHYCIRNGAEVPTDKGIKKIEDIVIGDMVATRKGYKRVEDSFMASPEAEVRGVVLSNGSIVWGTPDHKVLVADKQWSTIDSLRIGDTLTIWRKKYTKLSSTEWYTADTQITKQEISSTTHPKSVTSRKAHRPYTKRFGSFITEIFQKEMSFIIKTIIRLITLLKIWCVLQEASITVFTQQNGGETQNIGIECLNSREKDSKTPLQKRKTGSRFCLFPRILDVKNGVLQTLQKDTSANGGRMSTNLRQKILLVLDVVLSLIQTLQEAANIAQNNAEIVAVLADKRKTSVYDLTVEEEHEYFANGILVSNCHTLLYCLVGMDKFANASGSFVKLNDINRFPIASRQDNSISGRRVLGKRIQGYVDF
jgi:hypothetical protein